MFGFLDKYGPRLRDVLLEFFSREELVVLARDLGIGGSVLKGVASADLVDVILERIAALEMDFADIANWIGRRRPDIAEQLAELLRIPTAHAEPPAKGIVRRWPLDGPPPDDFPLEALAPPGDEDIGTGGGPAGRDESAITIHPGTPQPNVPPTSALLEEAIRLDVAAPPYAIKDEPFDLAVAVRQPDAPLLAVEDLTQVSSEEGAIFRQYGDEVVLYRIEVTAAGCDVAPPDYTLKLRPRQNSRPCFFNVTPHRTGKQFIVVTAYQADEAVAAQTRLKIEVQVPVGPAGIPRSDYFTPAELLHIAQLLLQAGMDDIDRQELLILNMNPLYRASLPEADSADVQLRRWLDALNTTAPLTGGELPFETFLLNAVEATKPRVESVALQAYLDRLRASQVGT